MMLLTPKLRPAGKSLETSDQGWLVYVVAAVCLLGVVCVCRGVRNLWRGAGGFFRSSGVQQPSVTVNLAQVPPLAGEKVENV